MSGRWKATLLCWPYSTGKGNETDQKNAGDPERTIDLGDCAHIGEALEKAKFYQMGIESSPHVWQAPIIKLEQVR